MGIRRLARELNLSIGTVSRALNERPDVSDETRARVKSAAAAAGYAPNQSGRSLRKGCTGIVAAVVPTALFSATSHGVFFEVIEGARRVLVDAGVDLVVLFRGLEEDPLENLARIVSRRVADGIMITHTQSDDPRIPFLIAAELPFVAFGRSAADDKSYAWADLDFEGGVRQAVRVLHAAGHPRVGLVTNALDVHYNKVMRAAFEGEAAGLGYGPADRLSLITTGVRIDEAGRAALADPARAPTGFVVGNEAIAAGLYADLAALGRPVGAASAVISATPVTSPLDLTPPLSGFDTDLDALGGALASHLLATIPGVERRPSPASGVAPTRFVPRASHLLHGADAPSSRAPVR